VEKKNVFCPKCGIELPDDSQFCRKCGQSLTVSATHAVTEPSYSSPLLLAVVGVLAVLFVAGWFVNHLRSKKTVSDIPAASVRSAATPLNNAANTIEQPASTSPSVSPLIARPPDQPAPTPSIPRVLSFQEIYQRESAGIFLIETYDDEGRKRGTGSGFAVSSDGTAITNYHVIRGASRATVKFGDGTVGSVDGVGSYDNQRDVAVIRLTPAPETVLEIGDSDNVQVGDKVVAIGSPLGLENTMSVGIVSALRNGMIQMSDPISPGSSGGAVLNEQGKVIAISSSQITAGQNLNFAIPINWVKPYLNRQAPRPLSDIAAENTVIESVLDGSVTIPQGQARTWNITINPNNLSNAEVHGQISSTGGADGKITLMLVYQGQPIFSCRERICEIHQSIARPGVYTLILDNRISPIFGRAVTGQISLKYAR
jgi:S1-C subfamily serine protease